MKKNLAFLKKNCYDVNWLDEWVGLQETEPEITDSISESENAKGKQARKRRCPGKDDDLLTCPFEGCEKTYLSKTSLRLHVRRLHKPDSVMKKDSDVEVPRFSPILRGVRLERVFKKEDFEKLNYRKAAYQDEEVHSTKKVQHVSDENKQESDASDLVQERNFKKFDNRKPSGTKPKFSACDRSIDGARPLTIISNDRSCTKTRISGTASTNATALKYTVSGNHYYKEDSETNSVIGFDKKHFLSGQQKSYGIIGDDDLRLDADPEEFGPDAMPNFLYGEGDFGYEAFHILRNRSFSITDEKCFGENHGIFGSLVRKDTELENEQDYRFPEPTNGPKTKISCAEDGQFY